MSGGRGGSASGHLGRRGWPLRAPRSRLPAAGPCGLGASRLAGSERESLPGKVREPVGQPRTDL